MSHIIFMPHMTLIFLAALAAGLALQMWLYERHNRHVAAHRETVPLAFAEHVPLVDHQKGVITTRAECV